MKKLLLVASLLAATPAMAKDWTLVDGSTNHCVPLETFGAPFGLRTSTPEQVNLALRHAGITTQVKVLWNHTTGVEVVTIEDPRDNTALMMFSTREGCESTMQAAIADGVVPSDKDLQ